ARVPRRRAGDIACARHLPGCRPAPLAPRTRGAGGRCGARDEPATGAGREHGTAGRALAARRAACGTGGGGRARVLRARAPPPRTDLPVLESLADAAVPVRPGPGGEAARPGLP